jgi:hypothetical protein
VRFILGWVTLVHQAGAALAAYLAGLAHGAPGDYQAAFLIQGMVALRVTPATAVAGPRGSDAALAPAGRPRGRHLPTGLPG